MSQPEDPSLDLLDWLCCNISPKVRSMRKYDDTSRECEKSATLLHCHTIIRLWPRQALNFRGMGRKKILADFKKKTAKVGKKLTPTNQKKIKVSTKKIWLPNQNLKKDEGSGRNEKEELLHCAKHLKGQSDNGRINSLQRIAAIFNAPEASSLSLETVPLVVPSVIELLFDDEREIREETVMTLSSLAAVLPATVFSAVAQLIVSTIRSALNHFNKTVRKDAMVLLCALLEHQPVAMESHAQKVSPAVPPPRRTLHGLIAECLLIAL